MVRNLSAAGSVGAGAGGGAAGLAVVGAGGGLVASVHTLVAGGQAVVAMGETVVATGHTVVETGETVVAGVQTVGGVSATLVRVIAAGARAVAARGEGGAAWGGGGAAGVNGARAGVMVGRASVKFAAAGVKSLPARADSSLMPDFMPAADGAFDAWVANFVPAVRLWWEDQGYDTSRLDGLFAAWEGWQAAYPAHVAAIAAARAAAQAKDGARVELMDAVRPIAGVVQADLATTDAQRATLGITVRKNPVRRTPPPASRPLVLVGVERLGHTLRLLDEGAGEAGASRGTRRARPRGVVRAEVFVAVTQAGAPAPPLPSPGDADSAPEAYRYLTSVSDGSTNISFQPPQAGKTAHYIARWMSTTSQAGPWSDTAAATIAA